MSWSFSLSVAARWIAALLGKLVYRVKLRWLHVDEKFIREAFSDLAQLDLGDWVVVERFPHIQIKCWGNEVHIRVNEPCYECIIKEGVDKNIYVDEWREELREVSLEFGVKHPTNWWEVFRCGKHITGSTRWYDYLCLIAGFETQIERIPWRKNRN